MAYTVAFCKRDYSSAGIQVISASNQHQGDPYTLFEKCSGLFEVPRIGLVEVGKLGWKLNAPTQGRQEAQVVSGLDPSQELSLGHIGERLPNLRPQCPSDLHCMMSRYQNYQWDVVYGLDYPLQVKHSVKYE